MNQAEEKITCLRQAVHVGGWELARVENVENGLSDVGAIAQLDGHPSQAGSKLLPGLQVECGLNGNWGLPESKQL